MYEYQFIKLDGKAKLLGISFEGYQQQILEQAEAGWRLVSAVPVW